MTEGARSARFEALCAALRRNDPDITEIPFVDLDDHAGHSRSLWEALQGNHYVSSMELFLSNWLYASEEDTGSIALLLRYIRESKAMRKIKLWGEEGPTAESTAESFRAILLAISENPCIEKLDVLFGIDPVADSFALFLRTTKSLKTLVMMYHDFDGAALPELVAEAIGANQSLESLKFESYSDSEFVESVLVRLGLHPRLRELKLECGDNASITQIHALAKFLGSTTMIEHLELNHYVFDEESMEHLVDGLHSNQSLTKLALIRCKLNLLATNMFRTFMQSCETRSSIRELRIGDSRNETFQDSCTGPVLVSMLTTPDENQGMVGSSIGSSLQFLELEINSTGFCDAFADAASRIRLPCLRIHNSFPVAYWDRLIRCLPRLVYLNTLKISNMNEDVVRHSFVGALRNNGSLQHVAIHSMETTRVEHIYDEAVLCLIQTICKRNEMIPKLVAEAMTSQFLLPMLFQSAKQALRTAPNAMLVGLLTAGNTIGPTQHSTSRRRPYNTQETESCDTDDNAAGDDDILTRPNKKSYGSRKPKKRM